MKPLLFLFSLLFFVTGFSQVQHSEIKDSLNQDDHSKFNLQEPAAYTMNDQDFTFSPELNLIHIKKHQNEGEMDFGDLRQTTDDGLYIMTSNTNQDVSFGRFDSIGNFRTLRYDQKKDTVIEEWYMIKNPEEEEQDPE